MAIFLREDIGISHAYYDHSLVEQDINVVFPIQRFVELEKENIIGRVADTHYSFSYVNDFVRLANEYSSIEGYIDIFRIHPRDLGMDYDLSTGF